MGEQISWPEDAILVIFISPCLDNITSETVNEDQAAMTISQYV